MAKRGQSKQYLQGETFRWNVRSLMVLLLLPETRIKAVFDELRNQTPLDDADSLSVYNYFKDVWFDSFLANLLCQIGASFLTNNVAESFRAALSRRILHHHLRFNLFARQLVQVINESKTRHE